MNRLAPLVLVLVVGCNRSEPTAESGPGATPPAVVVAGGKEKPADEFPPPTWTQRELADYLAQKGLKVEVRHDPLYDRPDRPAANFATGPKMEPVVLVYRCQSKEAAHLSVGAMGDGAFSFGHFAIGYVGGFKSDASRDLLNKVRAALG